MRRAPRGAVGAPCESRNVPLDFTAIDFETANGSSASACSVGLVKVRDGQVVDRIGWFIQPPAGHDHFVDWNTRIHGITADMVLEAPTWVEQLADLVAFTGDDEPVAHDAGFERYSPGLILFQDILRWMDTTPYSSLDLGAGDYRFKRELSNAQRHVNHGFVGVASPAALVREAAYSLRATAESLPLGRFSELPGKAMRRIDLMRGLRSA